MKKIINILAILTLLGTVSAQAADKDLTDPSIDVPSVLGVNGEPCLNGVMCRPNDSTDELNIHNKPKLTLMTTWWFLVKLYNSPVGTNNLAVAQGPFPTPQMCNDAEHTIIQNRWLSWKDGSLVSDSSNITGPSLIGVIVDKCAPVTGWTKVQ